MLPMYVLKQAPENVVIGAGSLASSTSPVGTSFVRLSATSACHYKIGSAATVVDRFLPAGVVEFVPCPAGTTVNVIQDTAAGVLNIAFVDGV